VKIEQGGVERAFLLGLGWIAEQREQFAVPELADGPFGKDDVARLKPLSELTLTIWVLKRYRLNLPFLDETAAWIWAQTDQGSALLRLLLARPDFLPSCAIYAMMHELGFTSRPLAAAIAHLARLDLTRALPLQPWARLALSYNLARLGHRDVAGVRLDDLYLAVRPEPWMISGELGYAITHETFYLSDFGFEPTLDRETMDYLRVWLPYWTAAFVAEGDWDLAGEMAMAALCIGLDEPTGLSEVVRAQDDDGSIQGPDGAGAYLFSQADSSDRRRFLGRYHTTLVLVMATSMALARRSEPRALVSSASYND
jgi:hypothetical protein